MKKLNKIISKTRDVFSTFTQHQNKSFESQLDKPTTSSTKLDFNPSDPKFFNNPYEIYTKLREQDPVHNSSRGFWVLSCYKDVSNAFTNPLLGNSPSPYAVVNKRNRNRYICADVANNIIPFLDAPEHNIPRKILSKTFHDHLKNNPPNMEIIARNLLEPLNSRDEFDLLSEFSTPLSLSVICSILGIPQEDGEKIKIWSESFFYLFTFIPSETIRQKIDIHLEEFRNYLSKLIQLRRVKPENDLISAFLKTEYEGEKLSDLMLIDNCMLLFADSVENVDAAITSAIGTLLLHPEQMELVIKNDHLLSPTVNEYLRYETPAQFVGKIALENIEIHNKIINKNDTVLLLVGSANRDPEQFVEPHKFDIQRNPNDYLSFGKGRHNCIGGILARKEMEAAIRIITSEYQNLQLKDKNFNWRPQLGHRWLESLVVKLKNY